MGYVGATAQFVLEQAGFTFKRDDKLTFPTALVDGSRNINFHEGGVGKRGGTSHTIDSVIGTNPAGRGLYQFRLRNGNSFIVFATSDGKVYHTNYSNEIATGMSTSNYFHFSTFNNECYIADGATVPKYWTGSGSVSSVTPATSWASNGYPFQIIPHSRGSNARMWAITKDSAWASKNNDGHDFSDAEVKQIPVYTEGGLVGGIDFGGTIIVFSKTKSYLIDDSSTDTDQWGYVESIWEGGASHWRLIIQASNNVYVWTDEGLVYMVSGVQATGDYVSASITRPAFIDRWIRESVTRANVENFNVSYDRTLRCLNYFIQVGGSSNNTNLKYFIDKSPDNAWIIHDNLDYPSGMKGAASAEIRVSPGVYKIYTQDYSGQIWKHEQNTYSDNGNPYKASLKLKPFDFDNLQMYKHFRSAAVRASAISNFGLKVRPYIDGIRKDDINLSVTGTGAIFDVAVFDMSVFASDSFISVPFQLGYYGFDVQFEILNETAGEDFFMSLLFVNFKNLGVRTK
jgi:hypothetical protein